MSLFALNLTGLNKTSIQIRSWYILQDQLIRTTRQGGRHQGRTWRCIPQLRLVEENERIAWLTSWRGNILRARGKHASGIRHPPAPRPFSYSPPPCLMPLLRHWRLPRKIGTSTKPFGDYLVALRIHPARRSPDVYRA